MRSWPVFILLTALTATIGLALMVATSRAATRECESPRPEWLACEDFEAAGLDWAKWFERSPFVECNGCSGGTNDSGRIRLVEDPAVAHGGDWSLNMPASSSANYQGASLTYRSCAGPRRAGCRLDGHEALYLRTWVRLAEDHQYVHHFLSVAGTRPDAYWESDGNAGCRPDGERWAGTTLDFNRSRELFFYTYFPEMKCDRGGYCGGDYARQICEQCAGKNMPCDNGPECCWGNSFGPVEPVVLARGEWVCLELGMRLNSPGTADGTMAFWVNDVLVHKQTGMHWRDVPDLKLNKAWLQHYIAAGDASQSNRVWFDDMVVSTERIGCGPFASNTATPESEPTTAPTPAGESRLYLPRLDRRADDTIMQLAQLGGAATSALQPVGEFVLAGIGEHVIVFEVGATGQLEPVATTPALGDSVRDMALDGDRLYVAASGAGLQVFDVAEPIRLERVATLGLPGPATMVAVAVGYAIVGIGNHGWGVVQVSGTASPRLVAWSDSSGSPGALATDGQRHVFIAHSTGSLSVVDLRDPQSPREVGHLIEDRLSAAAVGIAVGSGLVYVTGDTGGFSIIDVSNPATPFMAGQLQSRWPTSALAVVGTRAYVADPELGLRVLDVSDAAAIAQVGSVAVPGGLTTLAAAGARLVGGSAQIDVIAFNLAEPTSPRELSRYAPPRQPAGLAIGDSEAYVLVQEPVVGLAVVDVRAGAGMGGVEPIRLLGLLDLDAAPGQTAATVRVDASGRTAYLLYDGALLAVDCRLPAAPRIARLLAVPDGTALTVQGSHLYVAGDGLRVIDVSAPRDPRQVGYDFAAGTGLAIAADGNQVYVAQRGVDIGRTVSLWVYDVATPAAPRRIGTLDDIGPTADLAAGGGLVFQVGSDAGVTAYDVRDPSRLHRVSSYRLDGLGQRAELVGERLFVAEAVRADGRTGRVFGRHGVRILDVSRADALQLDQFVAVDQFIADIGVTSGRLLLAVPERGLLAFDLPTEP